MTTILREVHKNKIYYDHNQNRWVTYVADPKSAHGRRLVARKKKSDLEKYLVEFYACDRVYTFDSLYEEFMEYKSSLQAPTTIDAYVKSYKRFYKDDPIIHEDLNLLSQTKLEMWLAANVKKYQMDYKSLHKIRSTYISRLRDAGMSFEKIAEEVGHQQIQTTMNNYSFDVNTDEENLRMMNAGLNLRPSVRGRLDELKKAASPAVHTAKYAEVCI